MRGADNPADAGASRLELRLVHAHALIAAGRVLEAESEFSSILAEWPRCMVACRELLQLARQRGDTERARELLHHAHELAPEDPKIATNLALSIAHSGHPQGALDLLRNTVAATPEYHPAWFQLGQLYEALGDLAAANRAWFQAIRRAQNKGLWLDESSTPPTILANVVRAMQQAAEWRRNLLLESFSMLREAHGSNALKRVDRALSGYLKEWDATPADPRQRPRFLYFPDIPSTPYLDPSLVPWTSDLQDRFAEIKAEARQLMDEEVPLTGFLTFNDGDRIEDYLSGTNPAPEWNAFFFYRHGKRYEENHLRCPATSALLDSLALCRIRDQAPEICFSVLAPGSHIMPHYGVTNARVVVHLPLIIPGDCALNIIDAGAHEWQEGRVMVFDDSYRHEAWNRSSSSRVILLMDSWNPHLSEVETQAMKALIEAISDFEGDAKLS